MAKLPKDMPHIKRVTSKGKLYEYFDCGTNAFGRQVLQRLPSRNDKGFGGTYASLLAARTKRLTAAPSPTVSELSREYQLSKGFLKRAENTQNTYLIYLRKVEEEMGGAPVREVEQRDVQELIDKMGDKPGATRMALLVIRNMWKLAMSDRRRWATVDPTINIELPDEDEDGDHEPWPDDLLDAALKDPLVGFSVALLYYTGQRIGDVCKMAWTDIEDDGTLYVYQQKTKKEVYPPIHSGLQEWFDKVPEKAGAMLPGPRGKAMQVGTLRSQLQRWARARDMDIVPHGLRKNAVIALLEADCTLVEAASITGQSLAVVEQYAKRRNNKRLARSAMLKWDRGTDGDNRKP